MRRFALRLSLLAVALWLLAGAPARPQPQEPKLPLEEIVRRFAEKEEQYARAHGSYRYELSLKVQELVRPEEESGQRDRVIGEFEQAYEVGFDSSGRRRATPSQNPHNDLKRLGLTRVEFDELGFIPLFILSAEQIPDYEITYVGPERVDEVDTFMFRLEPNRPVRPGERFFDGIVWVDAEKLDIVRALGRSLPAPSGGALNGYFQRLEIFREPVDDYLFPTYVRADDVLTVHDQPIRLRLIVRFGNHQRARELGAPEPPRQP